jgi:hypothetical protein
MSLIDIFSKFKFFVPFVPLFLFFNQIQNTLIKIFGFFWKQRSIETEALSSAFYISLKNKYWSYNFDNDLIRTLYLWNIKEKKYVFCALKLKTLDVIFYKGFIPVIVFGGNSHGKIKVSYLKGTFNFDKALREASLKENTRLNSHSDGQHFRLNRVAGDSLKSISNNNRRKESIMPYSEDYQEYYPILGPYYFWTGHIQIVNGDYRDYLVDQPRNKQTKYQFTKSGTHVLRQVERWMKSKEWYEERNITWRRGILLKSRPGNGKSSLVFEVAKKLNLPLYSFDLSSFDNSEFCEKIDQLTSEQAVLLFEDIDTTFNKERESLTKTEHFGALTFDCFINKLSGVDSIKNKFVFMTTNFVDKLDPALYRSGRIDEVVDLPPLDHDEKLKMAQTLLDKPLIERVMFEGVNDTTADFENRCVSLAINNFWQNEKT